MEDKNILMYKSILLADPDFFHQNQSWKTEKDLAASTRKYLKPLVEVYQLITTTTLDALISELGNYVACCVRESINFTGLLIPELLNSITAFWNKCKTTLPAWYDFATGFMYVAATIFCIRRKSVFYFNESAFGDFQTRSLHDKVATVWASIFSSPVTVLFGRFRG